MECLSSKNLERALESRRSEYVEARTSAYYQVTTEFAVHKNVDEERAKSDLEENQLVCVSAATWDSLFFSAAWMVNAMRAVGTRLRRKVAKVQARTETDH
jgi:hypothetical protein